jgi:hypothetical protein
MTAGEESRQQHRFSFSDMARARKFYEEKIGLEPKQE